MQHARVTGLGAATARVSEAPIVPSSVVGEVAEATGGLSSTAGGTAVTRSQVMARVRRALQRPEMRKRLSSLQLSAVEGDGDDALVALVADLLAMSDGSEGTGLAKIAGEVVLEVVEETLDLTEEGEGAFGARERIIGVFFSYLRALPAPDTVIALPAPAVVLVSGVPVAPSAIRMRVEETARAAVNRGRPSSVLCRVPATFGLGRPWPRVGAFLVEYRHARRVLDQATVDGVVDVDVFAEAAEKRSEECD